MSGDDRSADGLNVLGLLPWLFLSVAWLALTATKLAGMALKTDGGRDAVAG